MALLKEKFEMSERFQQLDIAGNVVKSIDARGNPTNFGFGQCSFAFPTSVTNALIHTTSTAYDCSLGKPTSITDPNGTLSTFSYNDALDRPTQAVRASGVPGVQTQTTFAYDDTNRKVTTTSDLNTFGDNLLKSEVLYDGLGRQTETRRYENTFAFIATKQTYDALGRVSQVSNPFRPASEADLRTTTQYDALGRVTTVTTPDGAQVITDYSGNQTTIRDQAGKTRRSITDAPGRLVQVIEDPFGLAHSTTYAYDALDNLTTVTQGVQTRSFVYDSLSRLTQATNPESGGVSYEYDPNGNLVKKTDARGIITCYGTLSGTLCSADGYDALNRVTRRSYSDGTPLVSYAYDAPGAKGRLTSVTSSVSSAFFDVYDALGRVKNSRQLTDGQTYSFSYTYDLAGNLTSQTYPSGRVLTFSHDGAGRVSAVGGTKTYASLIGYASHGAIKEMRFANVPPGTSSGSARGSTIACNL